MKSLSKIILLVLFLFSHSVQAEMLEPTLLEVTELTYSDRFDEAISLADSYIASHPSDPRGLVVKAMAMDWKQKITAGFEKKLDGQILEMLKNANLMAFIQWERDPKNIDKMITLGNSYLYLSKKWVDLKKQGRAGFILKKCRKHLEEAISLDPKRYDAYLALGLFNFYMANIPPGFKFLAGLLGMTGNEAVGLKQLKMASENKNLHWVDAKFILAYAFGKTKKDYPSSLAIMNDLVTRYPKNVFFRHFKAEYETKAKQYALARVDFSKFLGMCSARAKNPCSGELLFEAHYYLASGYIVESRWNEAAKEITLAEAIPFKSHPDMVVKLHYNKGIVFKALGKKSEAIAEFRKVENKKELNPKAWEQAKKELLEMGEKISS